LKDRCSVAELEDGKDNEVQARQGFRQALVIARQTPEAIDSAEAALHDPPAR
jgi:hypothetical protein